MSEVTIIGIDLAKRIFHLHGAGHDGSVVTGTVQVENALCQIDPDNRNLGHGCSLLL